MIDFNNMPQPTYSVEWENWVTEQIETFGSDEWMKQWRLHQHS